MAFSPHSVTKVCPLIFSYACPLKHFLGVLSNKENIRHRIRRPSSSQHHGASQSPILQTTVTSQGLHNIKRYKMVKVSAVVTDKGVMMGSFQAELLHTFASEWHYYKMSKAAMCCKCVLCSKQTFLFSLLCIIPNYLMDSN